MCLQTIEGLLKTGVIVVRNRGMEMPNSSCRSAPRRMLKGRTNCGTLSELCQGHQINYCDIMEEMLPFIKQTAVDDPRLPNDTTEFGLLSVERFPKVEILVSDFQEADFAQIHQARCAGTQAFRKGVARNESVWVQTRGKNSNGIFGNGQWRDY